MMRIAGVLFALTLCASQASAEGERLVAQGVAGDMDAHNRSPVLTVSTEINENNVKILADAFQQHPEYRQYPIRFDFYIDRKLFSTQLRSPELPGAVGVDIGPDIAVPPFNYAVVAEVVHPNRNFTSVIQGAVFTTALAQTFDCTLTLSAGDAEEIYVQNGVQSIQSANNLFSISFEANRENGDGTVAVAAAAQVTGEDVVVVAKLLKDEQQTQTELTGTATIEQGNLTAFKATSADGNTELSCS